MNKIKDTTGLVKRDSSLYHINGKTFASAITAELTSEIPINRNDPDWILQSVKVDPNSIIEIPAGCIEFAGKNGFVTIGSLNNFSAIIGKAKSKKTFLVTLLMGAILCRGGLYEAIKCRFSDDANELILFDTEQATHHVIRTAKRALHLAEASDAPNFFAYCLRKFPPKERMELIRHRIYNTHPGSIVIIDGVRDLAFDINSGEEATHITSALMKWTEERQIHIIVIIHQNKGDNNARGHLGAEITNKAETVLSVTKDPENPMISCVEPEYCRDKEFEPFAFSVNEQGLPYLVDNWIQQTDKEGKKKALVPHLIELVTHKEVLNEVFRNGSRLRYKQLQTEIKTAFQKYAVVFGDNKAAEFISYYKKQRLVRENEGREQGERTTTYSLCQPL